MVVLKLRKRKKIKLLKRIVMETLNLSFPEKMLIERIRERTNRKTKTVIRAYLHYRHLIPTQAETATILHLKRGMK